MRGKMNLLILSARRLLLVLPGLFLLSSCSGTITSALFSPALDNMQEQPDIELVCEGTPAYLLMVDSLIAGEPESATLLTLGTKAYSGYLGVMPECGADPARIKAMTEKAYDYSARLLEHLIGAPPSASHGDFRRGLENHSADAEKLVWAALGWVSWVQQQQGAPAAMADLGKIEMLLQKIIERNDRVEGGLAHFLLGAYYGSRPDMLGGNSKMSRYHFERAIDMTNRQKLIYLVTYAETYGRNTGNKTLHDKLLQEVMDFPLESSRQNTLTNQIAKNKADRLIKENFF